MKYDDDKGRWFEVGDEVAREKVGNEFRVAMEAAKSKKKRWMLLFLCAGKRIWPRQIDIRKKCAFIQSSIRLERLLAIAQSKRIVS